MNITSVKAELIAICIGLIKDKDNQNIIVITDSFSTTRKVIKSYIIPCHDLAKNGQVNIYFSFSFLLFSDYYFSFHFHFIFLLMNT